MKVTYNWLKQYVDFDWSPDELAERLTHHHHHLICSSCGDVTDFSLDGLGNVGGLVGEIQRQSGLSREAILASAAENHALTLATAGGAAGNGTGHRRHRLPAVL